MYHSRVVNNVLHFHVLLLPTVFIKVTVDGVYLGNFRAMCDSGSEVNLIRTNVLQKTKIQARNINASLVGITESAVRIKQQVSVQLEPWFETENNRAIQTDCWVLPKSSLWSPTYPSQDIPPSLIKNSISSPVADPFFWKSGSISLLLGIEVFTLILEGITTRVSQGLIDQESAFGHIVSGRAGDMMFDDCAYFKERKAIYVIDLKEIDKNFQRIWEFEDLSLCGKKDADHEMCEQLFEQSHLINNDGRHVVKIPLKPNTKGLGKSRQTAVRRFDLLEKRGQRDPALWEQYVQFMREYESLGHMVHIRTAPDPNSMHYYIPHHPVKSANKFRVVFDGSCKTTNELSLNDIQFTGPKLQLDLSETLIRFRRHRFAVSADIVKMYRQIEIAEEHQDLQRIIWRENPNQPLREYRLKVITYGLSSSPYLAVKAMIVGAELWAKEFPDAVQAIKNDCYMDDCITGANSEQEAITLAKDIEFVLNQSKLPLRKWRSNSEQLVQELAGENEAALLFDVEEQTSVLGMKWIPRDDEFTFVVHHDQNIELLTKRAILSIISRLFDPIGLAAAVITKAKLLVQELWKSKLNWDEPVSETITAHWNSLWSSIGALNNVRIPRWVKTQPNSSMQLHGFADSSGSAYGCCVYLRSELNVNKFESHLIFAKSKVAPIKAVTIPRLELAAAQLLSQTITFVRRAMELENIPYFLWTDSTIALQWIRKEPHELKLFVANRVRAIQSETKRENWFHVRTDQNPADLISRGVSPEKIVDNKLWWHGPWWLSKPQVQWPKSLDVKSLPISPELAVELKVQVARIKPELFISMDDNERVPLCQYSNNIGKLIRIVVYLKRFIHKRVIEKTKKPTNLVPVSQINELNERPTAAEKRNAFKSLIKIEQRGAYQLECAFFQQQGDSVNYIEFPPKSKLLALRPFMDADGLIRVGGRLDRASMTYDQKHPVIIPTKSRMCKLLMHEAHCVTEHGSVQMMSQYLRNNYWIPLLRNELRVLIKNCVTCVRFNKKFETQLMAELPADRVNPNRAFLFVGVDYAGPIEVVERYKTRSSKRKAWIAIFVCLVTRAIHIDVVTEYSAVAFIQCFERFVSRRGHCRRLYSDNGTNFVGAYKELKRAFKEWHQPCAKDRINNMGTDWIFVTPAAPHQNGISEAAVKSTKFHLRRIMGKLTYTYEHLVTVLTKIEAVLNSRPLHVIYDDPTEPTVITPGHFLIFEPFVLPPPIASPPQASNPIKHLRNEQQQALESFWKVWRMEYLTSLMQRKKWAKEQEPLKIGQIVVVTDEATSPSHWPLGKIVELLPSKDGLVRSIVIEIALPINPDDIDKENLSKSKKGRATTKLTRPVQKVCVLPDETEFFNRNRILFGRKSTH